MRNMRLLIKSETVPRYHAREVAAKRAELCGATLVLGSATPSLESYYKAKKGEYTLLELTERVQNRPLPVCHVIDLRDELKAGKPFHPKCKITGIDGRKAA